MYLLYKFLPSQFLSSIVDCSYRCQMKPYHLWWAWALKNVMLRGLCEWAIKMLGVLLIFLLRRRQRERWKWRRILGEEVISCGCDLIKFNYGTFCIFPVSSVDWPQSFAGSKKSMGWHHQRKLWILRYWMNWCPWGKHANQYDFLGLVVYYLGTLYLVL